MANDVLACRRETRRRRILENSENRLQKITGRSDNISKVTFDNDEGSLLSQNGTSSRQVTNGQVQQIASSAGFIAESRVGCHLGQPVKSNRSKSNTRLEPECFGTLSSTSELSKHMETFISTSTSFYYLYAARLHLICLAVLVRIMLVNYGFMFGESLVAPLCVVEVTELLWLQLKKPQMTSPPGLLGAVLLLSGISSQKVVLISNCIHMLTKVVQDTCIYFFTFVTFHAILEWQENIQHNS